MLNARAGAAALAAALWAGTAVAAAQSGWFQYRGPGRDGRSTETGLATTWSDEGPREVWRVPIGSGFSAVSVVGGRLYTMTSDAEREYAVCYDAATGEELWRVAAGELFHNDYGNGPRSTPTVDGERVFVLGSRGRLMALAASDGGELWRVEFSAAFDSELPTWAFTSAPLVDGDAVIAEVGGSGARAIAAFDRAGGALLWSTHEDVIVYSSPIAVDFAGTHQFVSMTKEAVVGLDRGGNELWSFPFAPEGTIKPAPPVFVAPDLVFVSASYGIGAKVVRLRAEAGGIVTEPVWEGIQMRNHFNGSVSIGEHLYGFDTATLKCVEAATGEVRWAKRRLGKGSLIEADGVLIILSERGKLVLAEATSEGYRELAAHQVLQGRCWTQPSLWDGQLYLRNHEELVRLDLRAEVPGGSR